MGMLQVKEKVESQDALKKPYPTPRLHAQEYYDYAARFVASDERMFNLYRLNYERSVREQERKIPRCDKDRKLLFFLPVHHDNCGPFHTGR